MEQEKKDLSGPFTPVELYEYAQGLGYEGENNVSEIEKFLEQAQGFILVTKEDKFYLKTMEL